MASDTDLKPPAGPYPPFLDLPPYTRGKLLRHYGSLASLLPPEVRKNSIGVINSATAEYHLVIVRIRAFSRWMDRLNRIDEDETLISMAEIRRELLLEQAREKYARGDWIDPRHRRMYAMCFGSTGT